LPNKKLLRLLGLKEVPRKGWTRHPIPRVESVADHSYGAALLAWLLCPSELDRARVLELALLHDLAEVVTGDLIPADGVPDEVKKSEERDALEELLRGFPARERALELLQEYQAQNTAEARHVKAMDRLDMALQSQAYEQAHGVDLKEFRESAHPVLERAGLLDWLKPDGSASPSPRRSDRVAAPRLETPAAAPV
jgi:putative hydrolase of HD superfamily